MLTLLWPLYNEKQSYNFVYLGWAIRWPKTFQNQSPKPIVGCLFFLGTYVYLWLIRITVYEIFFINRIVSETVIAFSIWGTDI